MAGQHPAAPPAIAHLLACFSPGYLKSEYCRFEFTEYLKGEIGRHLYGAASRRG
jgi:hypothetical protein